MISDDSIKVFVHLARALPKDASHPAQADDPKKDSPEKPLGRVRTSEEEAAERQVKTSKFQS